MTNKREFNAYIRARVKFLQATRNAYDLYLRKGCRGRRFRKWLRASRRWHRRLLSFHARGIGVPACQL